MSISKKARFDLANQLLQVDFLNEREKDILRMRLGLEGLEPCTLHEIGTKYNITRERIRQIGSAIIRKTKKYLPEKRPIAGKLFEKSWEPKYLKKERYLVQRRAIIKRNRTIVRNRVKKLAGYIEEFEVTKGGKEKIFKLFKILRLKFRRNKSLFEPDVIIQLKGLRQRWKEVRKAKPQLAPNPEQNKPTTEQGQII